MMSKLSLVYSVDTPTIATFLKSFSNVFAGKRVERVSSSLVVMAGMF